MTAYKKALEDLRKAEAKCIAELFNENCEGNPYVTDEDGNWLSKEEVYEKLLRGDKK